MSPARRASQPEQPPPRLRSRGFRAPPAPVRDGGRGILMCCHAQARCRGTIEARQPASEREVLGRQRQVAEMAPIETLVGVAGPSITCPPSPETGSQRPSTGTRPPTPSPVPGPTTTTGAGGRRSPGHHPADDVFWRKKRQREREGLEIIEEQALLQPQRRGERIAIDRQPPTRNGGVREFRPACRRWPGKRGAAASAAGETHLFRSPSASSARNPPPLPGRA